MMTAREKTAIETLAATGRCGRAAETGCDAMKTARRILIDAAERIHDGRSTLACNAIVKAASPLEDKADLIRYRKARDTFLAFFFPTYDETDYRGRHYPPSEDGMPFWNAPPTPERQRLRVMALLFAAATLDDNP